MRKKNCFSFILWFAAALVSVRAAAFIPPVVSVIKEAFEGRKSAPAVEVVLRHHIEIHTGEFVDIDERLLSERGQVLAIWSGPVFGGQNVAASYASLNYSLGGDRSFPTRSGLFLRYFFAPSSEAFQESLIGEQFLRRDQLLQYRPGVVFSGDPQSWDLRQNYLAHDDIFLHRLESGIAISIIGSDDGNVRKTVFFDRDRRTLARLEWRDKTQVLGWNFDTFSKVPGDGVYPRRMALDVAGTDIITTTFITRKVLKDRPLAEFKSTWRQSRASNLTANAETALKMLLSYR